MTTLTSINQAAHILQQGGLVAFPTETVYGLGADASNEQAVQAIFRAKGRPLHHPLIVHIADIQSLSDWALEIPPAAWQLAKAFWPGPLTLIMKKQPWVLDAVTGGQDTIGLRIPRHPIAQALLQAFGGGVAAPSANQFTRLSPTTAAAVNEELGNKVEVVLDGGECAVGLESTIVDVSGERPIILRPGGIAATAIVATLQLPLDTLRHAAPLTRAPGMHALHYAPMTKTILMATSQLADFLHQVTGDELPLAVLTHSDLDLPSSDFIRIVKMPSEVTAYAQQLYQTLRLCDHQHVKRIIIEATPSLPAWEAINDRLMKATAMR